MAAPFPAAGTVVQLQSHRSTVWTVQQPTNDVLSARLAIASNKDSSGTLLLVFQTRCVDCIIHSQFDANVLNGMLAGQ